MTKNQPSKVSEAVMDQNHDIPRHGRSLFARLVFDEKTGQFDIPFPFSKLIEKLETKTGLARLLVMVPFGRSLHKHVAKPDYLKFPRVLVTFQGFLPRDLSGFRHHGGELFLGYNEKARSIEIISYNYELGRFEFELVHNYQGGSDAVLWQARRDNCLKCHQGEGPIFADSPWAETTSAFGVSQFMKNKMKQIHQSGKYLDFRIPYAQTAESFDKSVRTGQNMLLYQLLWENVCGNSSNPIDCRARIMHEYFSQSTAEKSTDPHWLFGKGQFFEKYYQDNRGLFDIATSVIPDHEPMTATRLVLDMPAAVSPTSRRTAFPAKRGGSGVIREPELAEVLRDFFEPQTQIGGKIVASQSDLGDKIIQEILDYPAPMDEAIVKKLNQSIQKLKAAADDDLYGILRDPVFNRPRIIQEVYKGAGLTVPRLPPPVTSRFPKPILQPKAAQKVQVTFAPDAAFLDFAMKNCGRCHVDQREPFFLQGYTAEDVIERLKNSRKAVLKTIDPNIRQMPPEGEPERRAFWAESARPMREALEKFLSQ